MGGRLAGLGLWALLGACGSVGPEAGSEPVDPSEVVRFAERIGAFYGALENRSLDAYESYRDPELRVYFENEREFSDYYAALASTVRERLFRHARAERVEIRDFHFESPDRARVTISVIGQHQRKLRFWGLEIDRTDRWERVDGQWRLDPDKL